MSDEKYSNDSVAGGNFQFYEIVSPPKIFLVSGGNHYEKNCIWKGWFIDQVVYYFSRIFLAVQNI